MSRPRSLACLNLERVVPVLLAAAMAAGAAAGAAAQPRPIELAVDATDAPRGVFHARLEIPAAPGALTLAYPKWVQGEHTPTGPLAQVAGLSFSAAGKVLPWSRDALDPFLLHVEVPPGAAAVEVTLDYLSPPESFGAGYGESPNATPHLVIVDWNDLLVYPPGTDVRTMPVRASLRLPAGWQLDTALAIAGGVREEAAETASGKAPEKSSGKTPGEAGTPLGKASGEAGAASGKAPERAPARASEESRSISRATVPRSFLSTSRITGTIKPAGVATAMPM